MHLPIYQIDAFTSRVFGGNPAAVCPLDDWLPDETMQAIAAENNLSETAFFCAEGDGYALRWFTPAVEVDLCGHATLASGYLLLTDLTPGVEEVRFSSRSGPLSVTRCGGDIFALDFPAQPPEPIEASAGLSEALSASPAAVLRSGERTLAVFESQAHVSDLAPDMPAVARVAPGGLTVTAPGNDHDFVSRHFAPSKGIPEDPVTGSTHTMLTPYWAGRLGKTEFRAAQLSARGGELQCRLEDDRVLIAGRATLYMKGHIFL